MGLSTVHIEVAESQLGDRDWQWMKYCHIGGVYSVYGISNDILRSIDGL